jgi:hypothetical protein
MIIAHFHIVGVVVITPDKADTVLVVDPYAVLAFPVTFKRFKAIARRKSQVVQDLGSVHHFQLPTSSAFYLPETPDGLTIEKALCVLVSKRLDHAIVYSAISHKTSNK